VSARWLSFATTIYIPAAVRRLLMWSVEDRMPTRPVESTHEAEPNYPIHKEDTPGVESPSADRMQGSPSGAEMHSEPDPSAAGPRESMPEDKSTSTTTNEDDASQGDQDIDTAGTAHDDLSPTKSM
jgi:hypothetical protein